MNKEQFVEECKKIGIIIKTYQIKQLEIYKEELKKYNEITNLTTIIEDNQIYLKHFFDSLCLIKATSLEKKEVCDFGTGAGFPGMVLAIIFENSNFTLLESNNKKVVFLNNIIKKLNLKNVKVINERAEIYGKNNREKFDLVTCRAVSNLCIITELSISLLKVNGYFIPLKSNVDEELLKSEKKYINLGYILEKRIDYLLPFENSNRTLLIFKKIKTTEKKYPRNYNIIKKECCK